MEPNPIPPLGDIAERADMTASHNRIGHAALRRGRASEPGRAYLLTFAVANRQPIFADAILAMTAARALVDPRLWASSQLLAWVLMPDHCHALLVLGEPDDLASLVRRIKTNTGRRVRHAAPWISPVWARAYHDRAIRDEDSFLDIARYVVRNPIRAGLVERVGDYPFWDAAWVEG